MTTASPLAPPNIANPQAADASCREATLASPDGPVQVGFLLGLPRSGTTLLSFLLAGSSGSLSLSEPYLAQATFPRWQVRWLFRKMGSGRQRMRYKPPALSNPRDLLDYVAALAKQHQLCRVLIKETYRCSREWRNADLMDWIAGSGCPVAAVVRHPYDVAVSSIRFCRHWRGLIGRAMRLVAPGLPLFRDDHEVAAHVAENWVSFVQWCERQQIRPVRYEDLVMRTEAELRGVCERLGIPFEARMLVPAQPRSAFGGIGDPMVMKQSGRPVKQSSVGRKAELPPACREIVARVCADDVGRHAYEL